jgi:hypothetical protein
VVAHEGVCQDIPPEGHPAYDDAAVRRLRGTATRRSLLLDPIYYGAVPVDVDV